MEKRTFAMIKPDAVACHYTGQIITLIEKAGFRIIAQKMLRLTTSDTNKFYAVHSQRPFFRNLSLFMTSGPVVVMVLEKENALTSSMRTPKPIIKQWCDPLMTFHKHCSCYSLLTLR